MKLICILITLMSLPLQMPAQTLNGRHPLDFGSNDVTNAPLQLFINGSGQVLPLRDGQMLEVGRDYSMTAIPDWGYAFTNWQPVNVFTIVQYSYNSFGQPSAPITSTIVSPVPNYTSDPRLRFTLQPVEVIYDVPGVRTITETEGWQANFGPVIRGGSARNW